MPIGHTFLLCQFHQRHQSKGDAGDQEDDSEHFVKGEGFLHPGHVHAQTAEAAQPLADNRAHNAVSRGNPKPGKELGQRSGEFNVAENLQTVRAHGA